MVKAVMLDDAHRLVSVRVDYYAKLPLAYIVEDRLSGMVILGQSMRRWQLHQRARASERLTA